MANRPKAHLLTLKGDDSDKNTLVAVLTAIVDIWDGELNIPASALDQIDGTKGLRARYEEDGSITLWTYDRANTPLN